MRPGTGDGESRGWGELTKQGSLRHGCGLAVESIRLGVLPGLDASGLCRHFHGRYRHLTPARATIESMAAQPRGVHLFDGDTLVGRFTPDPAPEKHYTVDGMTYEVTRYGAPCLQNDGGEGWDVQVTRCAQD